MDKLFNLKANNSIQNKPASVKIFDNTAGTTKRTPKTGNVLS